MKFLAILLLYIATVLSKQALSTTRKHGRIIGGTEARSGQFPFVAALNIQTSDSSFFCGGALLNTEWILTSAHCVNGAVTITIRLGSATLTGTDPNRVTVASSHAVVHPDFDPATSVNDIGLIKLRLPVELGSYIYPIGLTPVDLPTAASLTAVGWGQISDVDSGLADNLQYVGLAVVSNAECQIVYGNQISNNTVCVGGNYNEGICYGDTGSALIGRVVEGTSVHHVGVASFFSANGCESTDPSGYTRTYPYVDWIRNVTG